MLSLLSCPYQYCGWGRGEHAHNLGDGEHGTQKYAVGAFEYEDSSQKTALMSENKTKGFSFLKDMTIPV